MTAYEVLQKLQKGWLNEKLAPELLTPLTEEVDCMMAQLKSMEASLPRLEKESVRHHQLEIERVRYLIASYLRTRLAKIQKYAWSIRDEEIKRQSTEPSKLTSEENKFLKEYLQVKRAESVIVDDAEGKSESQVDLPVGSQFIMKYRPVSHLVNSNDVQLV
ncbi:unnamed protein product [Allacma fusca]|uniref:DNA replication complex GINS protein SLD5 n=1 Tax=Allacma fusca TaxID=39272 RepID=A0A8J2K308_9HEXA|nr:unnamed protein product [Allacma fusca]